MNNNIVKHEYGTTISISKLPDCAIKERLLKIVTNQDAKIVILAVLSDDSKSWSAYAGYPDIFDIDTDKAIMMDIMKWDFIWLCENVRNQEQVKMMGDLFPENVAKELFPDWKDKPYIGEINNEQEQS